MIYVLDTNVPSELMRAEPHPAHAHLGAIVSRDEGGFEGCNCVLVNPRENT